MELPDARRLGLQAALGQAAVTVAGALVGLAWGPLAARSALLGGGISTAGTLAMTLIAFRRRIAPSALRVLGAFFAGELAKLLVVVALLVLVLKLTAVAPLALLGTYGATFLVYWILIARALPRAAPTPERRE
jgi:F0F1-type ATP synthase assembly protein I